MLDEPEPHQAGQPVPSTDLNSTSASDIPSPTPSQQQPSSSSQPQIIPTQSSPSPSSNQLQPPTSPKSPASEPRLSITIPERSPELDATTQAAVVNTPMALQMATAAEEAESKYGGILPSTIAEDSPSDTPMTALTITLLALSGLRSTFALTPDWLKRHKISHENPLAMTVYNLKECIWRDWNEEALNLKKPSSPHLIRLIFLGKLWEDKSLLRDCRLQLETPNVVHLSLRPSDVDNDDVNPKSGKLGAFGGGGGGSGRGDRGSSPSCRCVIL